MPIGRAPAFLTFCVAVVMGVLGLSPTSTVQAHSDLDYTLPTDGAFVGDPVSEITVAFVEPVTLVGVGFEVLDPQGNLIVPVAVTDDDMVFRLQLNPPIGGGTAGVRWEVTSADGHVIDGSFSFTIEAPAPSTTIAPSSTVAPSTSEPSGSTSVASAPATTTDVGQSTTTPPSASTALATTVVAPPAPPTVESADDDSSRTTLYLMAVGAGVAALIAFVMIRSRR